MRTPYLITVALLTAFAIPASADQARQRWPDGTPQPAGEAAPQPPPPQAPPPQAPAPQRTAVPRNEPARETPPPAPAPAPAPVTSSAPRENPPARATAGDAGQRTAQPRDRRPPPEATTGRAVPRGTVQPQNPPRTTTVYSSPQVYNYYYPRRYYPYGYGTFGLGYFYYDPYSWYPYDPYYQSHRFSGYGYGYPTGELRLRVRPRNAEVYVDGYYAGRVDDFDGMFQALQLEAGAYSIEIVEPGFQPIQFDVRIQPGRKVTYDGDLRVLRP